ncbi:Uncharacterised protein [Mycoplasmopsis californica]|uniref:Lipoprotein n=1 Tax=Mycoplasmopsis equigenitalium TaxID=114883 RepID=A0ABY5J1V2_9BACT|nr:hypothetical protein [Mycoplasmopsis equigenitalium]UUD36699.1 hypothetical protein NPA09_02180 [Mycoplasmopsis equigenitalium]VEU69338.1 Uncharacterised protein [Mycoplasmopsis californica]
MSKNKLLLFGFGTVATLAATAAFAVSCGEKIPETDKGAVEAAANKLTDESRPIADFAKVNMGAFTGGTDAIAVVDEMLKADLADIQKKYGVKIEFKNISSGVDSLTFSLKISKGKESITKDVKVTFTAE